MPTLSSMKIPPPKSWEEFEEITLDSCKIRWENPDLQMHGRQGQAQSGVDIFGSNHLFKNIGVQCKNYNSNISSKLIISEIQKAESFKPQIEMFYFATSTKTDVNIQREIRILSQERTAENKFPVMVLFWEDIVQELVKNQPVFKKHYPQFNIQDSTNPVSQDIRLFSILDLVYNLYNLDFYNNLIFGEVGQMAGENPLQIQSVILTIKYSSSNVLIKSEYEKMAILIDKYKDYLFQKGPRKEKFSWDIAEQLSNEFTGIVDGAEYSLPAKELAVFNIAKLLAKWSQWELNSDKSWPKSSRDYLRTFVTHLESDELTEKFDEFENRYNEEEDSFKKLYYAHDLYNEIRRNLINLNK